MGHSSIQVTVDLYGHLIPGENTQAVDRLDSATLAQPADNFPCPVSSDRQTVQAVTKREYGVDDGFPQTPRNYGFSIKNLRESVANWPI